MMSSNPRRLKRLSAIFFCTAIVASSGTAGATRADSAESATAKIITIPIRTSQITVQYDPAAESPVAELSYARMNVPTDELLSLSDEVIPVIKRITGCDVTTNVAADRVLSVKGNNTLPLSC